jgi:peptide chain release factor subunit 3
MENEELEKEIANAADQLQEKVTFKPKLNPFASNFNPNASSFVPTSFGAPSASASSTQQPPQAAAQVKASKDTSSVEDLDKVTTPAATKKSTSTPVPSTAPSTSTPAAKKKESTPVVPAEPEISAEELEAEEEFFKDAKEHLNIVFIGHVDAGKSTMGGHLLLLTGMVDKRTMEKYEKEAKEQNRESWYLSWALDLNPEERAKVSI